MIPLQWAGLSFPNRRIAHMKRKMGRIFDPLLTASLACQSIRFFRLKFLVSPAEKLEPKIPDALAAYSISDNDDKIEKNVPYKGKI